MKYAIITTAGVFYADHAPPENILVRGNGGGGIWPTIVWPPDDQMGVHLTYGEFSGPGHIVVSQIVSVVGPLDS